ncbi:MAG TPA: GGDEF domain-containing phosphodiesterase [Treponemataceae bacterium]|jgi:EAL domain-containing protein (putative c-di-GMP-specific phosphodiesterase class I)|nr:GGDEF domain-containing phosphodiesterase [Treponemataceae bacterium]
MIGIIIVLSALLLVSISLMLLYRNKAYYERYSGEQNWWWLWDHFLNIESKASKPYDFAHFDIKDFKMVNELFGHTEGDIFLEYVGHELLKEPWIKYAVRCHNDNFAIVADPLEEKELYEKLNTLFVRLGHMPQDPSYKIFYRCGAVCSDKAIPAKVLVGDFAKLAQAMGTKQNCTDVVMYTDAMKAEYLRARKLKAELPLAIKNNELEVYIQPKYALPYEKLSGGEALVRWNYQNKEIILPSFFIPHFEKTGVVDLIDFFVLETVCRKFAEWKQQSLPLFPISINLSRYTIGTLHFLEKAVQIVEKYGVYPGLIDFELTETAVYDNQEFVIDIMNKIKGKGFKLSMDDFGTGYSSLSLLQKMPLDTLKIDKGFVDGIETDESGSKGQIILKNILSMTKSMNITSLSEGVETEKQKDVLKGWGCEIIQGFYYNKPLNLSEYEDLLEKQKVDTMKNTTQ